jgi:hypothetical protein
LRRGEPARARRLFAEGLILSQDTASQNGLVLGLAGLARVAARRGEAERAGRLFGATDALFPVTGILVDGVFPTVGMLRDGSERPSFRRQVAAARRRLDADAFASGWALGVRMSREDAVAQACSESPRSTPGSGP